MSTEFKFGQVVTIKNDPRPGHREVVLILHDEGAHTVAMKDELISMIGGGIPYDMLVHAGIEFTVEQVFKKMLKLDELEDRLYLSKKDRRKLKRDLTNFSRHPRVIIN